jgi:hypothetical protein
MLKSRRVLTTVAALSIVLMSGAALADRPRYPHHHHSHGSRVHFGLTLGAPLWYPAPSYYYDPYPGYSYPAYPPAVVVRPAPQVYIERGDQSALEQAPAPTQYWYYCRDSDAYYPYVKECPRPWERVPTRPATP